jgi:hypothetical protein
MVITTVVTSCIINGRGKQETEYNKNMLCTFIIFIFKLNKKENYQFILI